MKENKSFQPGLFEDVHALTENQLHAVVQRTAPCVPDLFEDVKATPESDKEKIYRLEGQVENLARSLFRAEERARNVEIRSERRISEMKSVLVTEIRLNEKLRRSNASLKGWARKRLNQAQDAEAELYAEHLDNVKRDEEHHAFVFGNKVTKLAASMP